MHAAVLKLIQTLLYKTYKFTLFCDNLFGNPTLFSLLRNLGIGACSTTRRSITKPIFGNIDEWKAPWGTLRSAITVLKETGVSVLVSLWQDSNKVGFCTTIHNGTEWVVRLRKRPKGTSTSAAITKQPFYMFNPPSMCKDTYEHTRRLPILGAINNYNHFMGSVDIANQLQANLTT